MAGLMSSDTSDFSGALNDKFGGKLGENLASLMTSYRTSLQSLVIEVQPPLANFNITYVPLIYTTSDIAPNFTAYIDGTNLKLSTGSVTSGEFAMLYSTISQAWVLQVNNGGTWNYVKTDGTLVSGNGPFSVAVDPDIITGNNRLNVTTGLTVNESAYSQWFYKSTHTIGTPLTAGGNGRYEIRDSNLNKWLSIQTSSDNLIATSSD